MVLNLQRACEACIDIANILIKYHKLGIPQSARNSFELIANAGLISTDSATALKKMVGLRNIAVHNDQTLNLDIIIAVINSHLSDFETYSKEVAQKTLIWSCDCTTDIPWQPTMIYLALLNKENYDDQ